MSIINLLPDDYLQGRRQRRANRLCLVLFALVMSGVAGGVGISERTAGNTLYVLGRVNAEYAEATRMLEQMQLLETQKDKLLQKAQLASSLMERVPRSTLLGVITNALPADTTIVQFAMDTRTVIAAEPAGAKPARRRSQFDKLAAERATNIPQTTVAMEVTGLAATDVEVARFITNLVRNPLATAVDLVYSQEKVVELFDNDNKPLVKVTVREFQVKLELKPNADAMELYPEARVPLQSVGGQLAGIGAGGSL